jgi:hypothetical protein
VQRAAAYSVRRPKRMFYKTPALSLIQGDINIMDNNKQSDAVISRFTVDYLKFKTAVFLIISFSVILFSCQIENTASSKKFIIMASVSSGYMSGITGYYIVDGDDLHSFEITTQTNGYYVYEQDLDSPDSVMVSVNSKTNYITSIQLLIYDDGSLVKSVLETPTYSDGTCSTALSCYYEFTTSSSASASK